MVIATFNELGAFFRGISQYERAERYFEESLALLAKMGMQVSKQFAGVLLNYAGCFRFAGQLEKAEEQFLKAKFLFEQLDAQQDYEYVSQKKSVLPVGKTAEYQMVSQQHHREKQK